jgi:hypothetical protein
MLTNHYTSKRLGVCWTTALQFVVISKGSIPDLSSFVLRMDRGGGGGYGVMDRSGDRDRHRGPRDKDSMLGKRPFDVSILLLFAAVVRHVFTSCLRKLTNALPTFVLYSCRTGVKGGTQLTVGSCTSACWWQSRRLAL